MTDKGAGAQDRGLWERWRVLGEKSRAAEPDALLLAAYAEGRLSEAEAETVEAWLAATPEALSDIIAARSAYQPPPRFVYERILNNATALVPGATTPASAEILSFQPSLSQRLQWRTALAWSSIAASLVCASLIGFSMGSDAYMNLSGASTVDSATADGLGTPGLDSYFSEDSGT